MELLVDLEGIVPIGTLQDFSQYFSSLFILLAQFTLEPKLNDFIYSRVLIAVKELAIPQAALDHSQPLRTCNPKQNFDSALLRNSLTGELQRVEEVELVA